MMYACLGQDICFELFRNNSKGSRRLSAPATENCIYHKLRDSKRLENSMLRPNRCAAALPDCRHPRSSPVNRRGGGCSPPHRRVRLAAPPSDHRCAAIAAAPEPVSRRVCRRRPLAALSPFLFRRQQPVALPRRPRAGRELQGSVTTRERTRRAWLPARASGRKPGRADGGGGGSEAEAGERGPGAAGACADGSEAAAGGRW